MTKMKGISWQRAEERAKAELEKEFEQEFLKEKIEFVEWSDGLISPEINIRFIDAWK